MSISFWSYVTHIFLILISMFLSLLFIRKYAKKGMNKAILFSSFFVLYSFYSLLLILPFDIYTYSLFSKINDSNNGTNNDPNNDTNKDSESDEINIKNKEIINKILDKNYTFIFFMLISFSQMILPLIVKYEESGEFTLKMRIKESIYDSFLTILAIIIIFVLISLIGWIFDFNALNFLIIVVTNFQSIYAMIYVGHGILKVPRQLYLYSNTEKCIKYYQFKEYCKLKQLDRNKKRIIKILKRCEITFDYINQIKKYIDNNQITDEDMKEIQNKAYNSNKQLIKEEIEKEFSYNRSMVENEIYVKEIYDNIINNKERYELDLIKDNVEYEEKDELLSEIPIKSYKELVKLNAKYKQFDRTDERTKVEMQKIYDKWEILTSLKLTYERQSTEQLIIKKKFLNFRIFQEKMRNFL